MFSRWLRVNHSKSLLLLGPRRSGKTTLLQMLFPEVIYRTLDDYDYLTLAKQDPKALLAELPQTCILDEVQRVPELLIAVKYFMDQHKRIFFMTGSSSIGLIHHGSETLAGRFNLQYCPTVCWGEQMGDSTHRLFEMPPGALQIKEANRLLHTAIKFGGFPEVVVASNDLQKTEILKNYRDTYFTKDLLLLSNIENADALLTILKFLGVSLGSVGDISAVARESGVSYPTAQKYLNVLSHACLIFKLYSYAHGPAKKFIKAPKRYYSDNGIITALNVQVSEGQWLENFVISEIEKRRLLGAINAECLQFYRTTSGAEIDLVIETPECTWAIEIKATKFPSKQDVRQLETFVANDPKKRKGILLYLGDAEEKIRSIRLLPVAHLYRAF